LSAGNDAEPLSEREAQVARRYVEGLSYKEIARDLGIAPATVRTHLNTIYRKLEVANRIELLHRLDGGAPAPAKPDAVATPERRQLTMMFVDLVGSTALAARLDPEDMHELLRAYRDAVRRELERLGGHAAGYPGDGVVACFGWPRALEDAAERAVQAGLAVTRAVGRLEAPAGGALAARVGIATGIVVVDDLRGAAEGLTGGTPNLAARLQSVAEPGMVVIAASTRELVGETFDIESLGEREIKGLPEPVALFRVRGERPGMTRFGARHGPGLPPMVGREHELGLLLDRWAWARGGDGQAVLLTGEPGIGKSRLAAALIEAARADGGMVLTYQASPQQGDSPLWPIRRQLAVAARLAEAADDSERLHRLDSLLRRAVAEPGDALPLIAELLDIGFAGPRPAMSASRKRERIIAALVDQLVGLAAASPVLMLLEDAHWIDPTTLELLQRSIEQIADARALMLLTSRPDNEPEIPAHPHLTRVSLGRLSREASAAIIGRLAGEGRLGEELTATILARTDGVPLYLEELTKAVLEAGAEARAVPMTLQDSLMARLDRLGRVKEVAQIAACIGREFDSELLAAVAARRAPELAAAIDGLLAAELVFRKGARYVFKHALVQDAAYESLLRARRPRLHGRIAEALLGGFPRLVADEPQTLAHHLAEAGRREAAIDYYLRAADIANNRAANREARSYLDRALALNAGLPPGHERDRRDAAILTLLGRVLVASEGHGSEATAEVYERALRLCERASLGLAEFPIVLGLTVQAAVSGNQHKALARARRLQALAQTADDPVLAVEACYGLGITHSWRGELAEAREQLERGSRLYTADQHERHLALYGQDPGVVCGCRGAMALWYLGYPERAAREMAAARQLAQRLGHPFSINYILTWVAWLAVEEAVPEAAREAVAATLAYAEEQNFPIWVSVGLALRARLALQHDEPSRAADEIEKALDHGRQRSVLPYLLALAGLAACRLDRIEEGLARIDGALREIEVSGTRWPEVEVLRARANCQLALGGGASDDAEATLQRAVAVADRQQARMFGLRAAGDLARLWAERGERQRARDLLAPRYAWFTEGHATRDLVATKALLDALG
jgi:class 3 adenylate cyclase/tetratricopeptide (TPR) repeat protein